jgi:hypothetical protein
MTRKMDEHFGLILLRAHEFGALRDLLDPDARCWLVEALRQAAGKLDPRPPKIVRRIIPSGRDEMGRRLFRLGAA